ncbi:hypothetical protein M408DRAFT_26344 [Serendipita vermifera MAFF 305830]|uniref:Uncharacterized protein n=1 Tax=Serendipita vermifera MAFF 305830 TaxID=933852 RepID=A0A0C3AZF0_SERVB|nr:hypothetical protein M408DRAFT_26344 [Serendipita vermifera MAFF 305830]
MSSKQPSPPIKTQLGQMLADLQEAFEEGDSLECLEQTLQKWLASIQPVGHLDDIKLIENDFIRKTLGGDEAIFDLWQEVWKDFRNWTQSLSSSSPTEDDATLKMTTAKPLTRKRRRSTAEVWANDSQPATPPALESPVPEERGKQKGRVRFTIERPKATRVATTKMQLDPTFPSPISKKKLVILSDNEDEGENNTSEPECAPTAHSLQGDNPPKSKKRKLDFEDEDDVNLLPNICVILSGAGPRSPT